MGVLSDDLKNEIEMNRFGTADFEVNGKTYHLAAAPWTAIDIETVSKKTNKPFLTEGVTDPEVWIEMLIRKARVYDVDAGEMTTQKVFDISDKPLLKRMPVNTLSDLFGSLFNSDLEELEDGDAVDKAGND